MLASNKSELPQSACNGKHHSIPTRSPTFACDIMDQKMLYMPLAEEERY